MKVNKHVIKRNLTGYLFIAPQMLFFLVFLVYPIYEGIRLSLFEVTFSSETFTGLNNYIGLFKDPVFIKSFYNTIFFVVSIVLATVIFSLFVSSAVFDKSAGYVSMIRASYYIPFMVSMVVMSMIWSFLLNPSIGLISYLANQVGISINLLSNQYTVMPIIVFVTFATNVGQSIILYIAAMIGVPRDLFEAAEIDGANRIQVIFRILIPSVKSTTIFILLINTIAILKIFVVIQLLTSGGPNNSSNTLMFLLYNHAFKYNEVGVASAIGVIMLFIGMLLSIPFIKQLTKRD